MALAPRVSMSRFPVSRRGSSTLIGAGPKVEAAEVGADHGGHRAWLVADARGVTDAGPGGHCGASLESSAVELPPHIDTSDQPLPGPAAATIRPPTPAREDP